MMSSYSFKIGYMDQVFARFGGAPVRVLDLGCGRSTGFDVLLPRYPNVSYTGVEQRASSLDVARQTVGHLPNARLVSGFGESTDSGTDFDLVFSLSVLEHVKHLDAFLRASVAAARVGGQVLHRYDLGHALNPHTPGERLRVTLGQYLPAVVPAANFTTYPSLARVTSVLESCGVGQISVRQSQIPGLKHAMNHLSGDLRADLGPRIVALDTALYDAVGHAMPQKDRDRLFPCVEVTGARLA